MPVIVRRRQVQRAVKSERAGHAPTDISLVQNPPNKWRWFGNDGHYYCAEQNAKTDAIALAVNGQLKRI